MGARLAGRSPPHVPACHRGVAVAPRRSRPATRGVPAHLLRSTARDHGLTGRRRPGSQNPRAARSGGARVKAPVVSPSAHRAGRRRGAARSDEEDTTRGVALSLSLSPSWSQLPKSHPHLATSPRVTAGRGRGARHEWIGAERSARTEAAPVAGGRSSFLVARPRLFPSHHRSRRGESRGGVGGQYAQLDVVAPPLLPRRTRTRVTRGGGGGGRREQER